MIIMKPMKSGEWNKTQSDSTSITLPAAFFWGVHISGVATMTRPLANREVPATDYHAAQLAS